MINALKFVRGAVAKKDYQPALTHFRIANGRVMGYNGVIALSSPIDIDITAMPKAIPFVKAIERCVQETVVIHLTEGGKLALRSGNFKAFIDCSDDNEVLDSVVPEGEDVPVASEFLGAVQTLVPFVGTDASRPWAMGILLRGFSAYATNNIVLVEHWIGSKMPDINLPVTAVNELLRIGEPPIGVKLGSRSVTFFFSGDRWLRSQLLSLEWPDIGALLDRAFANLVNMDLPPVPEGLFDAVETIVPFVDMEGRIYFRGDYVATVPAGDAGAAVVIPGLPAFGAYHHRHLLLLRDVATGISFEGHPQPCPFRGKMLRGLILGMVDV